MNPIRLCLLLLAGSLGLGLALARSVRAAEPAAPLTTRAQLIRPAERAAPILSPDGTHLAWLGTTNGVVNLWVRPVARDETRLLSLDPRGTVRQPVWQLDSQAVLFLQDADDFGATHVFQAQIGTGYIRDLTPFVGVGARLVATSPRAIQEILVTLDLRDRRTPDLYRIDTRTGAIGLEVANTGDVATWYADAFFRPTFAQLILPTGETALASRAEARSLWRPLLRWGSEDSLGRFVGYDAGASNAWWISSLQGATLRLLEVSTGGGPTRILAQDPRYDVVNALVHPRSNTLEAVQFHRARAQWQLVNTNLAADFAALRRWRDADVEVVSRDYADLRWTVSFSSADRPMVHALYDRTSQTITPLYDENPALEALPQSTTRPFQIKARDGLALEGYLTLPPGVAVGPLPAVFLVHGGPWTRAAWVFDPEVAWLASRGYAVVQLNFRGSSGYGKDHFNAGDKEWGGKILLDLLDARDWAVAQSHADPKRLGILGAGFGGYVAMAMLARHPGEFAAGVSWGGPPDLRKLIDSLPVKGAGAGARAFYNRRVGHPETESALLQDHSPSSRAALLRTPLLIGLGGRDPQITPTDMDRFVTSVRQEGKDVEYYFFPDEGPAIRDPGNRLRFLAAAEVFLGKHLGGTVVPPVETENPLPYRR